MWNRSETESYDMISALHCYGWQDYPNERLGLTKTKMIISVAVIV
jgi:hypothetical protein